MQLQRRKQQGFTLIEIAIVLVIIGLLLGGVLKGQQMIENAKVKAVINDLQGVSAATHAYYDTYHQYPGVDGPLATLQARGGAWANITVAGTGAGQVASGSPFNAGGAPNAGNGHIAFFQALRAGGFLSGNPNNAGLVGAANSAFPNNSFGGVEGVTFNPAFVPNTTLTGLAACASQVPGQSARAIDAQLDDGAPGTGIVLATQDAVGTNTPPGAVAAAYNETQTYTICLAM